MSRLLVIQHVPHERLGTFESAFAKAGCRILRLDVYEPKVQWPSLDDVDGVVVMGGPMSVYQQGRYPFIAKELSLLRQAIKHELPILGVCLGAQLLAHALGAKVMPAQQKEIGWYPLMRESGAEGDGLFSAFGQTETVFQWHGDTCTLPQGAVRLASSPLCTEQAFRYRDNVYALQFHLEMTEALIRAWMRNPGNARELSALRGLIDPMAIRRQSRQHLPRLQSLAVHVAGHFSDLTADAREHRRVT